MNISQIREQFAYLNKGQIYLNHASTAPLSQRVLESVNSRLKNQSEGQIDDFKIYLKTVEETRTLLAKLINTTPDRIAFADNTSTGLNLLAQSLTWEKGDRIILNDIEFPANVYPFLNLQKHGVEIDFVKAVNGKVTAEDIIGKITPQTKLISLSFVQFLTGYRADIEKIGKVCKEKGIIFSIDAIQGLGAIRLDVEKDNIDFISCGTQKWLLGLQGLSLIYINKSLQEKMNSAYVGWLGVDNAWDLLNYNLKFRSGADTFQTGTINTLGIFALNASLKLFDEFGFNNVEERVLNNSEYLISKLEELEVKLFLSGCAKENLSGIVSFKSDKAQDMLEKLAEKNITVAVREGVVRLSPHFYNTKEDIDKAIAEIKILL